ncbi:putative lipid-transfer protein DIR1 [Ipomoea triloba]|uniref:putative lipid-transfer protein DIR1 n=1 Tax=Ipomoea triloba TaxID=35885 RepID=UPI00125D6A2F|nr:putative lipid-transfer protein DIR1 [Ipomoea triloba]GMD63033.1 putative lipid-transfer protein DIR1 [Ipomoea batatas]
MENNNNVFIGNKTPIMAVLMIMSITLAANIFHGDCYSLCNMSDDGLQACKPSVTPPNPVEPTAACCTALSAADLPCLCSQKGSPMLSFLGIDPDLAMALPNKCGLTPPTNC